MFMEINYKCILRTAALTNSIPSNESKFEQIVRSTKLFQLTFSGQNATY